MKRFDEISLEGSTSRVKIGLGGVIVHSQYQWPAFSPAQVRKPILNSVGLAGPCVPSLGYEITVFGMARMLRDSAGQPANN